MAARKSLERSGYVQNVSDELTSSTGTKYHVMQIQTDATSGEEIVCFSPTKAKKMLKFQDTKSPVKMRKLNDWRGTAAMNDFTEVKPMQSFEVTYEYHDLPRSSRGSNESVYISRSSQWLGINRKCFNKISVCGTVTKVSCKVCKSKMRVESLKTGMSANVSYMDNEQEVTTIVNTKMIQKILSKLRQHAENPDRDQIEDALLDITDIEIKLQHGELIDIKFQDVPSNNNITSGVVTSGVVTSGVVTSGVVTSGVVTRQQQQTSSTGIT